MKKNRLRRKDRVINGLIFVVIVGGALAVRYLPSLVSYWQSSEVYKRYSKVEGVRATYIKDFRVNDTVTVGVTLLEATTDSGWAVLQEDFEVPAIQEYKEYYYDSNKVSLKQYTKSVPLYSGEDTLTKDLITISYYKHTIGHFEIRSIEQKKAIIFKHLDDNIK